MHGSSRCDVREQTTAHKSWGDNIQNLIVQTYSYICKKHSFLFFVQVFCFCHCFLLLFKAVDTFLLMRLQRKQNHLSRHLSISPLSLWLFLLLSLYPGWLPEGIEWYNGTPLVLLPIKIYHNLLTVLSLPLICSSPSEPFNYWISLTSSSVYFKCIWVIK